MLHGWNLPHLGFYSVMFLLEGVEVGGSSANAQTRQKEEEEEHYL